MCVCVYARVRVSENIGSTFVCTHFFQQIFVFPAIYCSRRCHFCWCNFYVNAIDYIIILIIIDDRHSHNNCYSNRNMPRF